MEHPDLADEPFYGIPRIHPDWNQATYTVAGAIRTRLFRGWARIVSSGERRPKYTTELSGPAWAFEIEERGDEDWLRVTAPELVTMQILRVAR